MLTLMLGIIAWAAPRTAEQARKIAAEQARKLGITIQAPQLLEKASPRRTAARKSGNGQSEKSQTHDEVHFLVLKPLQSNDVGKRSLSRIFLLFCHFI